MPTRGWSQPRRILIIRQIGRSVLQILVSFFHQSPVSCPVGPWKKWSSWQGWRLCLDSATWTCTHLTTTAASASSQDQDRVPSTASFPEVISQLPGGRLIQHPGLLPSWKGQCLVFAWINTYSGYRCAFPALKVSAKTTIDGLTKCLIQCHSIPHSIASNQETHLTASQLWQGLMSWNLPVLRCSPPSWTN